VDDGLKGISMGKLNIEDMSMENILSNLRRHLQEGRPLTLYNTYKGIPITYEAEVAMVDPNFIGLIVHPYQTVCIRAERRTYLKGKLLPELLRAYPVSIDHVNHIVLLKDFQIPKSISTDLYNSWVSPTKPIKMEVSSESQEDFMVEMMEIAVLEENRVRVAFEVAEDVPYDRLDEVSLNFRFEPGGEMILIPGLVNSLTKVRRKDRKRMEVEGQAIMRDEITILAFIAKREDEIMNQLDKAYKKLRKGKKGKK
jgi:hypothetical protein